MLRSFGVKSIKLGTIPDDGSMSTMLVDAGLTLKDTATLKETEGTVTQIFAEEVAYAIENLRDIGAVELDWSTVDYDPQTLVLYKGGSVDGAGAWNAPIGIFYMEKAVQIITFRDLLIEIPRADLRSIINAKLAKNGLAQLDNKAVVLLPNKTGLSPIIISKYLAPTIDAGPDQPALAVANTVMAATAVAYRGTMTHNWTVKTKPAAAPDPGITTPGSLTTAITGLVVGVYVFQLTTTDSNGYVSTDTVTLTRTA